MSQPQVQEGCAAQLQMRQMLVLALVMQQEVYAPHLVSR